GSRSHDRKAERTQSEGVAVLEQDEQYRRDAARIEAHKLDLKADEFERISKLVRHEIREQVDYLKQTQATAVIQLNDRNNREWYVSRVDGPGAQAHRVLTVGFNEVRFSIEMRSGEVIHYRFQIEIAPSSGNPIVTGVKQKVQPLGTVSDHTVI